MIDWTAGACTAAQCIQLCSRQSSLRPPSSALREWADSCHQPQQAQPLQETSDAEHTDHAAQQHIADQADALLGEIVAGLALPDLVCVTVRFPSHNVLEAGKVQA